MIKELFYTAKMTKKGSQDAKTAGAKAGAVSGGVAGGALGALVGSVVPGAGTVIGAKIGAGLGTLAGGAVGALLDPQKSPTPVAAAPEADLASMTKKELKALAKQRGLSGYGRLNKARLVALLAR